MFCPKVLDTSSFCKVQADAKLGYAYFYYFVDDVNLLVVAYSGVEVDSGIVDEMEVGAGDFTRVKLTEKESIVSYYIVDRTILSDMKTLKEVSSYIMDQVVGPGGVNYLNGRAAVYGLDIGDFKSTITVSLIAGKLKLDFNQTRINKLRSEFESDDSGEDDGFSYSNFLLTASQRAVLTLISSIEGSISVKYPAIDTSVFDGMPCWFVKNEDLFLGSCTAPTVTWSVEQGASTEYSLVNLRSIKTCLELLNKKMSSFKTSKNIAPFFSTEGVLDTQVLDWREYCFVKTGDEKTPYCNLLYLFQQKYTDDEKKLFDSVFNRVMELTTKQFSKICVFIKGDYTNISEWMNSERSMLFSEISCEEYKYILPKPFFSSGDIEISNVKSIESIYTAYPKLTQFLNGSVEGKVPPFIYRGIGDSQLAGGSTSNLLNELKTFVKSIQQLPPYNVNWWDSGVIKVVSKVIWE